MPTAGHAANIPLASSRPASAPMNRDEKKKPPRKPDPSETIEDSDLIVTISAIVGSAASSTPEKYSAPCPDDIT